MSRFGTYFLHFRSVRSDLTGLPRWARVVFIAVALPGIALVALSIVAVVVSVVALLLLAVPVYALLRAVTRSGGNSETGLGPAEMSRPFETRHVDVKVLDPGNNAPDEVNGE